MAKLRQLAVGVLGGKISSTFSLVLLGLTVPMSVACNAIFGIEAGELVDGGALMTEGGTVDGGVVVGSGGRGSGGGGGTAGTGGVAGTSGSGGGSGSGGVGGSGGVSGAGGVGGSGGTTSMPGEVFCGDLQCGGANGSACCLGDPFGGTELTQCADDVVGSCSGLLATCDDSSDCNDGGVCCMALNGTDPAMRRIECNPDCAPDGSHLIIECLSARNCPPSLECCEAPDGLRCSDMCSAPICQSDADCPSGSTCSFTGTYPFPRCLPAPMGNVLCGSESCDIAQGAPCCYSLAGAGQPPRCDTNCPAGETQLHCDGHEDCGMGGQCCGQIDPAAFRLTQTGCAPQCSVLVEAFLGCTGAHNCPYPSYCCMTLDVISQLGSQCQANPCDPANNVVQLCTTDAECVGGACLPIVSGAGQPFGLKACQATP